MKENEIDVNYNNCYSNCVKCLNCRISEVGIITACFRVRALDDYGGYFKESQVFVYRLPL